MFKCPRRLCSYFISVVFISLLHTKLLEIPVCLEYVSFLTCWKPRRFSLTVGLQLLSFWDLCWSVSFEDLVPKMVIPSCCIVSLLAFLGRQPPWPWPWMFFDIVLARQFLGVDVFWHFCRSVGLLALPFRTVSLFDRGLRCFLTSF